MTAPDPKCAHAAHGNCLPPVICVRIIDGAEQWLCLRHARAIDMARGRTSADGPLNPTDEERAAEERHGRASWAAAQARLVRGALLDARVAADDIDALVVDMLRPLRRRELGRVLHRRNYSEAREKLTAAIGYVLRLVSIDDDHGDPSGSGGSPAH